MPVDPVVELLAKQPIARLREMAAQIDAQVRDLHVQGAWIQRALDHKSPTTAATPGRDEVALKPALGKRSSKRSAIKTVMQTNSAHTWMPSEVRDALAEQGIESTAAAVRVALRRMGDDGEVVRPGDGNGWKLAPTNSNGHAQQPFVVEAPSSDLGGSDQ